MQYSNKALQKYDSYVSKTFDDYESVFHEIILPDIHLNIIIIPPKRHRDYYTLITTGMGAYKMNVPTELKNKGLERAELVLYLLPTWNIYFKAEEDY